MCDDGQRSEELTEGRSAQEKRSRLGRKKEEEEEEERRGLLYLDAHEKD